MLYKWILMNRKTCLGMFRKVQSYLDMLHMFIQVSKSNPSITLLEFHNGMKSSNVKS